jgi:hypothetical protein
MRRTSISLKLATCLALGLIASSTGCKLGGWGGSWNPGAYVWNPMKMWKSDAPPPASSLAATTKPSTQVPTPAPASSLATRNPAAPNSSWSTPSPVYTASTPGGYGGATAPANATAGYPTTPNANGYPTQPATSYGSPNQPGQVAPAAGYAAGQYNMATPAGGTAPYQPTYTAAAQPGYQQQSPYQAQGGYQQQQPAAGGYQTQGYQAQPYQAQPGYAAPAQPTDNSGYNTPYSNPAGGYQTPAYNPPAAQQNGGYNTGGYIQGGYNTGASTQAPAEGNSYAAAPNNYDAAPAAAAGTPAGGYATAYTTPATDKPAASGMDVSGVTTGAPAVPASLASAGSYRPGSTGRTIDTGVANAGYTQPSTGYSAGGTTYR